MNCLKTVFKLTSMVGFIISFFFFFTCLPEPVITMGPRNGHILEGSDAVFVCEVSSFPLATIHWRKDGKNIFLPADDSNIATQVHSELYLCKITDVSTVFHPTMYMCYVYNTSFWNSYCLLTLQGNATRNQTYKCISFDY